MPISDIDDTPRHAPENGALDAAVGGPVGVVPGEDLCGPGDDGVDDDAPMFVKSWNSGSSPVSYRSVEPPEGP